MNILQKYQNENSKTSVFLDKVTLEFKHKLVDYIIEDIIQKNIDDTKTSSKLKKILDKYIKSEYNTLNFPYYEILENINFCIEVEMSQKLVKIEESQKFGEKKFTQILEEGIGDNFKIKRFAISEKLFLEKVISFIENYTKDFDIMDDSIKIEFN